MLSNECSKKWGKNWVYIEHIAYIIGKNSTKTSFKFFSVSRGILFNSFISFSNIFKMILVN